MKPVKMRMYDVTYFHKSDVEAVGEYVAKRYTDTMDADTLSYFLLSPDIVIDFITSDKTTIFF